MFAPKVLHPEPDPFFVRELKKIDPDLRVIWGYERYLKSAWAIERKTPAERYHAMYRTLLESGGPLTINQPIIDEDGATIGYRTYELAPHYEWMTFVVNPDDSFRELDARAITDMKRFYAWQRFQSVAKLRLERDKEQDAAEAARKRKRVDAAKKAIPDLWRELGITLFGGQPQKVMKGTQL